MTATILGPNGAPFVELGGERAWLVRVIGDVVASYQWLHRPDIDPEGPHPCMCLYAANRRMDTGAYVIPQRNAYWYADKHGSPTRDLLATAFKACISLGFDRNDKSAAMRMIDIIVEGVPDLVKMPSEQPGSLNIKRLVHGIEASAAINGKTIHQEVI